MDEKSVVKIFRIDDGKHKYYVQEMPGPWGMGRDYAIMKDRKRLYYGRFQTSRQAIAWLIAYVTREFNSQTELNL